MDLDEAASSSFAALEYLRLYRNMQAGDSYNTWQSVPIDSDLLDSHTCGILRGIMFGIHVNALHLFYLRQKLFWKIHDSSAVLSRTLFDPVESVSGQICPSCSESQNSGTQHPAKSRAIVSTISLQHKTIWCSGRNKWAIVTKQHIKSQSTVLTNLR